MHQEMSSLASNLPNQRLFFLILERSQEMNQLLSHSKRLNLKTSQVLAKKQRMTNHLNLRSRRTFTNSFRGLRTAIRVPSSVVKNSLTLILLERVRLRMILLS